MTTCIRRFVVTTNTEDPAYERVVEALRERSADIARIWRADGV